MDHGQQKEPPKKFFSYELDGLPFLSNIRAEELRPHLDLALQKIGGPYWQPFAPFKVEVVEGFSDRPGLMGETIFSEGRIRATRERLAHELIHFLLGPKANTDWTPLLQEFFAHIDPPPSDIQYTAAQLNHPAISIVGDFLLNPHWSAVHKLRIIALHRLNASLTDEQRIQIAQAAFRKRNGMTLVELAAFMREFGVDHAIFRQGRLGEMRHAFLGTLGARRTLTLVHYKTFLGNYQRPTQESRLATQVTLIALGQEGQEFARFSVTIGSREKSYVVLDELFPGLPYTSIAIPEWDETIESSSP